MEIPTIYGGDVNWCIESHAPYDKTENFGHLYMCTYVGAGYEPAPLFKRMKGILFLNTSVSNRQPLWD